jgi:hypothetical protein
MTRITIDHIIGLIHRSNIGLYIETDDVVISIREQIREYSNESSSVPKSSSYIHADEEDMEQDSMNEREDNNHQSFPPPSQDDDHHVECY